MDRVDTKNQTLDEQEKLVDTYLASLDYKSCQEDVKAFIAQQPSTQKIVCVTSGGTIVPLEKNMVRFLDNFSGGNRGSASVEYFLQAGYTVIFLQRTGSVSPFARHIQAAVSHHLDLSTMPHMTLDPENGNIILTPSTEYKERMEAAEGKGLMSMVDMLALYNKVTSENRLFTVNFMSLDEYLFHLAGIAKALAAVGPRGMFYLCAAVSDFYIPVSQQVTHKIQSSDGPLNLQLPNTPKLLGVLRHIWCSKAFCVSFKLETDPSILMKKAHGAINSYAMNCVVANVLTTRRERVVLVTGKAELTLERTSVHEEIEHQIIAALQDMHNTHCQPAE